MWRLIDLDFRKPLKISITLFLTIYLGYGNSTYGQNLSDLTFITLTIESKINKKPTNEYIKNVKNNKGEVDVIFTGLFLFYKTFLSSQDLNVCNFHPSCSEFAIQSIKRKGLILGGMKAFDRLVRCNGFSPEKYVIDIERKRLKDPVE